MKARLLSILFIVLLATMPIYSFSQGSPEKILLGKTTLDSLRNDSSFHWFKEGYEQYQTKDSLLELLHKIAPLISVRVFCGTWCEDTHRELPRFVKIADQCGIDRLEFYCLDREKRSPAGEEKEFGIRNIPTFIIYLEGKEKGRIVESALKSLEADMVEILIRP